MSEFQTISEIAEMVKRVGATRMTMQAGLKQNLFALPVPGEAEYDPPPAKMRTARPINVKRGRGVNRVNVMNGAPGSMGVVASGGARNPASSVKRFSGRKDPNALASSLVFSIDEYEMAQGDEAVDAVLKVFDAQGLGFAKYLARSFVNPVVANPSANVLATATSFTVTTTNGWWPGQSYIVVDTATGAEVGKIRTLDVAPSFDGTATVTFDTDSGQIGFAITIADVTIYLLGQDTAARRVGSIADATDSTLALYDIALARFPAGLRHALSGPFSKFSGRRLCSMVHTASSEYPTHWLGSPLGIDGIVNDQQENVRFVMGQSADAEMDPYADSMAPMFNGLPCIAEPVYDDNVLDLINADHLEMREYWPFRPRDPGAKPVDGNSRDVLVLDHDNLAAKAHCDGGYGTVFYKRRGCARFTSVTVSP